MILMFEFQRTISVLWQTDEMAMTMIEMIKNLNEETTPVVMRTL